MSLLTDQLLIVCHFISSPKTQNSSHDKKSNLPHLTQWCKDVYYSVSPIYTMCKLDLIHKHFVYLGEMEKYTSLHHCVTWSKFNFLPCACFDAGVTPGD